MFCFLYQTQGVSSGLSRFGIENKDAFVPYCGVQYLWLAFVCCSIRSQSPSLLLHPCPSPTTTHHVHGAVVRDVQVHGNIKPDNVLLTPEGRCKLTDFGLTTCAEDPSPLPSMLITAFGTHGGGRRPTLLDNLGATTVYTAPEVTSEVTPQADVWSLGILLLEILTGEVPHRDPMQHFARSAMACRALSQAASAKNLAAMRAGLRGNTDTVTTPGSTSGFGGLYHEPYGIPIPDNIPVPLQKFLNQACIPSPISCPPPSLASPLPFRWGAPPPPLQGALSLFPFPQLLPPPTAFVTDGNHRASLTRARLAVLFLPQSTVRWEEEVGE